MVRKRNRSRWARRRQEGRAAPGTLVADPVAPRPVVQVFAYGPQGYEEVPEGRLDAIAALRERFPVVWVNVDGLGDAAIVARLGELFGLHPLALEDVLNTHQRAKLEEYEEHVFLVLRMLDVASNERMEQFAICLGPDFVLSFQEYPGDCFDALRERLRSGKGRLRGAGPDYLAYALVDAVVDDYFPVLEAFGERLDDLEDEVLARPSPDIVGRIHDARHDLLALRRAVWPLRETLVALQREPVRFVAPATRPYLRDCYDHTVQALDIIENYREVVASLMDLYLSSVSNRMNEIMKVLTIMATFFIPLTFVAGLYGMNFDPDASPLNMPELRWFFGYPFCLGLMLALSVGLYVAFRRRGWIGKGRRHRTGASGAPASPRTHPKTSSVRGVAD